jgi:preprotein translocase subunit Sss1
MPRVLTIALACVALLIVVSVASAARKPTTKERAQIAKVIQLQPRCAAVRISTVTRKPKWATATWRDGGQQCSPFASNGVTVEKKKEGRWHFVTAGSSFDCPGLYAKVPRAVAKDLKISCT